MGLAVDFNFRSGLCGLLPFSAGTDDWISMSLSTMDACGVKSDFVPFGLLLESLDEGKNTLKCGIPSTTVYVTQGSRVREAFFGETTPASGVLSADWFGELDGREFLLMGLCFALLLLLLFALA